jgi:hypothetical protein
MFHRHAEWPQVADAVIEASGGIWKNPDSTGLSGKNLTIPNVQLFMS